MTTLSMEGKLSTLYFLLRSISLILGVVIHEMVKQSISDTVAAGSYLVFSSVPRSF